MKKKKIVVMRSYIVSLSCLYLMICSSCGNPRSGESKNEDNTKEIEIVKKEPITYNFYVEKTAIGVCGLSNNRKFRGVQRSEGCFSRY